MKNKKMLFLLSTLLLASCNNVEEPKPSSEVNSQPSEVLSELSSEKLPSETSQPTEEVSSVSEIETPSESEPEQPSESEPETPSVSIPEQPSEPSNDFDPSTYIEKQLVDVEEIYLLPDETYELSKMVVEGVSASKLNYYSDFSDYVSVEEDGTLVGITIDYEEIISGNVYVYDDTYIQQIDVHIVDYFTYGSYFTSVDLGRLYNKNVMFFGDSITHNWAKNPWGRLPETDEEIAHSNSVTSLGYDYHYVPTLNKLCKFKSVVNAAWSGGTMAYRPSGRPVYKSFPYCVDEHYESIKNADYIFVLYGTNDADDQVPIGTIRDTITPDGKTNGTFMASMKYGIETIREANPDAHIIFMNVIYRTRAVVGDLQVEDYNEAIDTMCKSYACRMIDTYSMFTPEEAKDNLNDDGLHLSEKGYKTLIDYILNNGQKEN